MQNSALSENQRREIEEDLIDTLCAWKKHSDSLANDTAAARAAMVKAKELKIWEGSYPSFKDWLAEECDITEQWAYALISASKVITEIEDAAAKNKNLKELTKPKNLEVLRALPERSLNTLKKLPAKKAAKAALNAITEAGGAIPPQQIINAQVAKLDIRKIPKEDDEDYPALVAIDNVWAGVQRSSAYGTVTLRDFYERVRKAVLDVL